MQVHIIFSAAIFTLFFSFIVPGATGQNSFEPGTIINANNKPVKGFILKQKTNDTPQFIRFKETKNGQSITLNPRNILGFKMANDFFFRGVVKVNRMALDTHPVKDNSSITLADDTVFLQALVLGDKNLYYIKKDNKEYFYYLKDNHFIKLDYKTYIKDPENPEHKFTLTNNKYQSQLIKYLSDCPALNESVFSMKYRKNAFIKIYQKYYDCKKEEPEYIAKTDKIKLEFGPIFGVFFNSRNIVSQSYRYLEALPLNDTTEITGGIFLDIVFPRYNRHLSLYNEMIYTACHFDMTVPSLNGWKPSNFVDLTLKLHNIKLFTLLKYRFYLNDFIFVFDIGMSNAINVADKITYVSQRLEDSPINYEGRLDIQKYETGFVMGAGVRYKGIGLDWKVEKARAFAPFYSIKINSLSNYITLSYSF